jgi:hypothetical protein
MDCADAGANQRLKERADENIQGQVEERRWSVTFATEVLCTQGELRKRQAMDAVVNILISFNGTFFLFGAFTCVYFGKQISRKLRSLKILVVNFGIFLFFIVDSVFVGFYEKFVFRPLIFLGTDTTIAVAELQEMTLEEANDAVSSGSGVSFSFLLEPLRSPCLLASILRQPNLPQLSGGAIAGIVIGVAIGVLLLAAVIFFVLQKDDRVEKV